METPAAEKALLFLEDEVSPCPNRWSPTLEVLFETA